MQDSAVYTLGIHDGHNCGATLTRNGEVVASVSEERLVRKKNAVGYPRRSIEEVLRLGSVSAAELSAVVYASLFMHDADRLEDVSKWYPVGKAQQDLDAARSRESDKLNLERRKKERIEQVRKHLEIREEKISFIEHHQAHLAAAYFTSPHRYDRPVLGLTCDGAGDNISATVAVCRGTDIQRIAETGRDASLGKIYSRLTFLMGMKPWEHEYKLMGLAPYADPDRAEHAAASLRDLLGLSADGLRFSLKTDLSTNYCYEYLRAAFERVRFDTIAAAAQCFTEELLVSWVEACIRATGIHDVVCGGGVFMNVKANMLIAQLPEVKSIYVMPSASDESLSIGACLAHYYGERPAADVRESRLKHLYFGGSDTKEVETSAVDQARSKLQYKVSQPNDMNSVIAEYLARGEIVAVCRGPMEWGARALGNRSILSTANDVGRIDEINQMIKMRDFWMPFAPSIREESADRYFESIKNIDYSFMTFAAPTRSSSASEIVAASHPKDRTVRPQIVRQNANANYHGVISKFEKLTGRGVVLNTSFNLHGEPIVATSQDAIRVMSLSGIRHLALNHHFLSK
jgi:carbamoyltransferase